MPIDCTAYALRLGLKSRSATVLALVLTALACSILHAFAAWEIRQPTAEVAGQARVNAGGERFTDGQNNTWEADWGYEGGNVHSTAAPIAATTDDGLYQTGRWWNGSGRYRFPVWDGRYTVTLKFAETHWSAANKRKFNVLIEGQTRLSGYDIFADAGGKNRAALDKVFGVDVSDGELTIEFQQIAGFDTPMVSAIQWEKEGLLPLVQISRGNGDDFVSGMAASGDGALVVVWARNGELWVSRSSDVGLSWSTESRLAGCCRDNPTLLRMADNSIWLVFIRDSDIWYRVSHDSGQTWSDEMQVTEGRAGDFDPDLAQTDDGRVWVIWIRNGMLWHKSTADGGASWTSDFQLPIEYGWNTNPSLAQAADGTLWVFWFRSYGLAYTTSIDSGQTWAPMSWMPQGAIHAPVVRRASGGLLFLAYGVTRDEGYGWLEDVYYQTSSDNGRNWTAPRQFTYWKGNNNLPAVAPLGDGRVALSLFSSRTTARKIWFGIPGYVEDIDPPPPIGSPTRTPSLTCTSTLTPSRTATPTRTPTLTVTHTRTATDTASPTRTRTGTATPSASSTGTHTPTATNTRTPSMTNTPTTTPSATPCSDMYEPDDSPAEALPILVNGGPQHRGFHTPADVDYIKFYAVPQISYVMRTLNLSVGNDTVIDLFDMDGTTLLDSADEGAGEAGASLLTYSFPATGTYFLRVRPYGPRTPTGCGVEYDLHVSASGVPTPLPSATTTASTTPTATSTPHRHALFLPVVLAAYPAAVVTNGGFEEGLSGWLAGGEHPVVIDWNTVHSDQSAARLGNPAYACEGGVPRGQAWISQTLQLPPQLAEGLTFWYRVHSQDHLRFDYLRVLIIDRDGNERQALKAGRPAGPGFGCASPAWESGWLQGSLDPSQLANYRGQLIVLRFELETSNADGWYNTWAFVDDVELR